MKPKDRQVPALGSCNILTGQLRLQVTLLGGEQHQYRQVSWDASVVICLGKCQSVV